MLSLNNNGVKFRQTKTQCESIKKDGEKCGSFYVIVANDNWICSICYSKREINDSDYVTRK